MYLEILKIKKAYYFFFTTALTIFLTWYIKDAFVSEAVYFKTFSETITEERIEEILNLSKSYELISYAFIPILLVIKVMYNTFIVTTATLLEPEEKYTFGENFNVCLKAEIVFALMNFGKIFTFIFLKRISVLNDVGYIPLSLMDLFNQLNIPKFAIYPLQTINIWEVLYCCLGTYLFALTYKIPLKRAIALFCIPYIIGVLILLLITSFIIIQLP